MKFNSKLKVQKKKKVGELTLAWKVVFHTPKAMLLDKFQVV